MALTRDSVGVSEQATVEKFTEFPAGSYVRTRHPFVDNTAQSTDRPLDYGQVKEPLTSGQRCVSVRWSQTCRVVQEDPSILVAVPESEYLAFVAGISAGYTAGYDDGSEDATRGRTIS